MFMIRYKIENDEVKFIMEGKNYPKLVGIVKCLRIYIGERGRYKGHSLYHAIVEPARKLDMAGANVLRGLEGYCANRRIHTAKIVDISSDLPLLVEIIDSEKYIAKILPFMDEVVKEELVTII